MLKIEKKVISVVQLGGVVKTTFWGGKLKILG